MTDVILVGDKVRSFDFAGDTTCFVEGVVEEIGTFEDAGFLGTCQRYKIKVERQVWGGDPVAPAELDDYVYPPINGTMGLMSRRPLNNVKKVS